MEHSSTHVPRALAGACDACRRRKVKCDAANPCANCTISQIPCEHRILPRKRGRPFKARAKVTEQPPSVLGSTSEPEPDAFLDASPAYHGSHVSHESHEPRVSPASHVPRFPELCVAAPLQAAGVSPATTSSFPTASSPQHGFHGLLLPIPPNRSVLDAAGVFENLVLSVDEQLEGLDRTVAGCVRTCVDLFMQYQFPNTPIAHEPTLRSVAALFDVSRGFAFAEDGSPSPPELQRGFTLITALCALVFSAMPNQLAPGPKTLVWPFYHASRSMLKLYEELDLETPHSSSYYIRTWQSAALQNTTGRDWASWHIHGEGTLLAMRARIYDEATVSQLPRLEARLLRLNFWLMYLADKTAAAFEARPYVINDEYLAGKLTLHEQGDHEDPLLDLSRPCNQNGLEGRLLAGFHPKRRLWAAAADVVREIRIFTTRRQELPPGPPSPASGLGKLIDMYLEFVTLVDHLPSWLQSPHGAVDSATPEAAQYQVTCFWAQRSNIMSVYHCMRMLILQKCIDGSVPEVVGLNDQPVSWAMQKLEIARDFLNELQMAPFACFKAQGESAGCR
ncbi:hypothetical protein ACHAQA_006441 [Verticillium albo-atrum]